ncbi:hypothetical protein [Methylobacterium sp. NEAU K]|uniref:hypothetical protein n=1 Tax=Methylobacterium sp. NEAU K TaxID=3064946 RepID=UPI00273644DE|nr:hypothetical protein [Methylobacterium sp. NEAU K]MDP4003289.1 hypothetical protein [Methylobacterium sp. NEAU K]
MSDDKGDLPTPPPSFIPLRYTIVLLNEHGEWIDIGSIYAVDDAEALAASKILAAGQSFEVWLGFHCLGSFSGTEH